MTMEDFIRKAVELGVAGVELTAYWLKSTEPVYLASLRTLAFREGMPVAGVAIGAQMCQPEGAKRAEVIETIRTWVDATEMLGGPYLRVFGDTLPPGATEAQGISWVAETMKAACEYSAKKGIVLGMETHMGLTVNSANVLEILRRVDSPFAACNLDISNWRERPYEQIEACLPFAVSAHIRETWGGEQKQPLDLDRVWQAFARHGYKGFMCIEYEGEEDPMTAVPKLVARMKPLCRKYSSV